MKTEASNRAIRSTAQVMGFSPQCDCGKAAVVNIAWHAIDYCHISGGAPLEAIMCEPCLRATLDRFFGLMLDEFLGVRDGCKSCDLKLDTLSAIIVRLCPLWTW